MTDPPPNENPRHKGETRSSNSSSGDPHATFNSELESVPSADATNKPLNRSKPARFAPGTDFDRYRLLHRLGYGGMGEVYFAQHARLTSRYYAIKFLKDEFVAGELRERFESEIDAMERLKHPNIVFAQDAGEFDGCAYLVMEFVDGKDLSVISKEHGALSISDAAEIIRQTGLGLQHAFEHSLVHRDLKPSNLMLSRAGVVKILDLGLARVRDRASEQALTTSMQLLGTPDYMAPEQCKNSKDVDIRADIYSLGCTLYCLLSGRPPFGDQEHASVATKLTAHLGEKPAPVSEISAIEIPNQLESIVMKMIAKDPANRFQTPQALVDAISPFAQGARLSLLTQKCDPAETLATQITHSLRSANVETEDTAMKTNDGNPEKNDPAGIRVFGKNAAASTEQIVSENDSATKTRSANFLFSNRPMSCSITIALSLFFVAAIPYLMTRSPTKHFEIAAYKSAPVDSQMSSAETKPPTTIFDPPSDVSDSPPEVFVPPIEILNPTSVDDASVKITVKYFARANPQLPINDVAQELHRPESVGDETATVVFGDALRFSVALETPSYCYLIALNPTNDPEFRIQLCFPDSETAVPERIKSISYPTVETSYFQLSDGVGQIAVVLIQSQTPLPTFSDWKGKKLDDSFPWKKNVSAGVWEWDGKSIQQIQRSQTRGDIIDTAPAVLKAVTQFFEQNEIDARILAFPVVEGNKSDE